MSAPAPARPTVPHPATLEDADLLKECEVTCGRHGGPGGQHRNKVETAVRIKHRPTGIEASGRERRSQAENRRVAIRRLRENLAREVRCPVHPARFRPSECWQRRRQGRTISINPRHRDYPALLAEALDVIVARGHDVAGAAGVLGISMSQLAKLVRHDKRAFAAVNKARQQRGLPALR